MAYARDNTSFLCKTILSLIDNTPGHDRTARRGGVADCWRKCHGLESGT